MKQLAIAFVLFVAACGGKSKSGAADPCADPCKGKKPGEPAAEVVTLTELSMGDVACYVSFTKADGTEETWPGDFAQCPEGESPLIGKKVTLRTEKGNVIAESCEGNPDCPDSEEVDLVVEIIPAE